MSWHTGYLRVVQLLSRAELMVTVWYWDFVPKTFSSQERKVPIGNIHSRDLLFPGTFVRGTFHSQDPDLSFPGTFVPINSYSWYLLFLGSCMFLLYCCSFVENKAMIIRAYAIYVCVVYHQTRRETALLWSYLCRNYKLIQTYGSVNRRRLGYRLIQ